jgi:hypothetical protein
MFDLAVAEPVTALRGLATNGRVGDEKPEAKFPTIPRIARNSEGRIALS